MRLKKIREGEQIIKFSNPWPVTCFIYLDKKLFFQVPANCFSIIEAQYFFVGVPLKHFPELDLYSNIKISVECYKCGLK